MTAGFGKTDTLYIDSESSRLLVRAGDGVLAFEDVHAASVTLTLAE